jgi:small-conductance mechanosensitive channel
MDQPPVRATAPQDPTADLFYSGALARIRGFMLVLALAAVPLCAAVFGARPALGLAAGCAIAWVNFYWLKRVISAFADRVAATETRPPSSGIVLRFMLRYFLMAIGAYVIFRLSPASVYGLLAGLFLPVAGIACEAVYELYAGLIRGL